MTLPGLSLSALPAISSVAGKALRTSAQAGSQFLSLLAGSNSASAVASTNDSATATDSLSTDDLNQRTASWSQRFMSWLRQQGVASSDQDFSVQLSLDDRDQPHALINGQPSAAVDQALSDNPTWLQEFRELALDRISDLAGLASTATAPMTLTIQAESDTMMPATTWT